MRQVLPQFTRTDIRAQNPTGHFIFAGPVFQQTRLRFGLIIHVSMNMHEYSPKLIRPNHSCVCSGSEIKSR